MPLYEYQCQKCEKVHEVMQKFSDKPMETCPECAGALVKLISRSSFALKGSGWYTTDYKRPNPKPAAPDTAKKADAPGSTAAVSSSATSTASSSTGTSSGTSSSSGSSTGS